MGFLYSYRVQIGIIVAIVALLIVILVPLSFSYVEYYEYGLKLRKTTGTVDTSKVYGRGRYFLGPDYKFLKYQGDAIHQQLNEFSVFSGGGSNESIGLSFKIDVDFTFFLRKEEVGLLHKELASAYESIIVSRAKDAVKNEAIFVTFSEYFEDRMSVEQRFRTAVQNRWDASPPLHCSLDQFHLGRIQIPDSVARKQLESRVQNERNSKETFLQRAQLERELTDVEVNSINLEQDKVLRTAKAEASLLRARATSEAKQIKADAQVNGTVFLFQAADIVNQEHMTAFTYIRALTSREDVNIDIGYLSPDNVVRTKTV